ncbi:MAG: archease [bacterium]
MSKKYLFLPHTADVKVQAEGKTLEDAFANSALALKEAICGGITVEASGRRRIAVGGRDNEALLCAFLEEFLYLLDAEGFLLSAVVSVRISGTSLVAEVDGDDAGKYVFSNSVKAVTYSEMFVRQEGAGWLVQFVLDV